MTDDIPIPSPKEKNLKELMEEMLENQKELINQKKEKKFKLPFGARLGKKALKQGYMTVVFINDNKEVEFMKVPIKEQTMMIKETPHLAMAKYMMTYKGKPLMIVPSWNVEPFNPAQNFNEAETGKTMSVGYRLLMNRMKSAIIEGTKKAINWWIIVGGIAVIAALGYVAMKGPNFKII